MSFSLRNPAFVASLTTTSPASALVAYLLAYAPAVLLVSDLGTLQGDGSPCVPAGTSSAACATWQDQSGNANHATQTTASSRPLLVKDGGAAPAALRLDGVDDSLGTAHSIAGNCTAVMVAALRRPTPYSSIDISFSSAGFLATPNGAISYLTNTYISNTQTAASVDTMVGTIALAINGAAATRQQPGNFPANAAAILAATASGQVASSAATLIGSDGASLHGQIDVNFFAMWDRILTSADLSGIASRLGSYYGITLPA